MLCYPQRNKEKQVPPPPSFQAAENMKAGTDSWVRIHRQESPAQRQQGGDLKYNAYQNAKFKASYYFFTSFVYF